MMRSSPTPESVLGKRTRRADDSTDGNDTEPNDTEPDNGSPSTTQLQSLPSISNVAAATLRYASKKKLRPEQRDEVDAFLLVSTPLTSTVLVSKYRPGHGARPTGQVICMHPVLRK